MSPQMSVWPRSHCCTGRIPHSSLLRCCPVKRHAAVPQWPFTYCGFPSTEAKSQFPWIGQSAIFISRGGGGRRLYEKKINIRTKWVLFCPFTGSIPTQHCNQSSVFKNQFDRKGEEKPLGSLWSLRAGTQKQSSFFRRWVCFVLFCLIWLFGLVWFLQGGVFFIFSGHRDSARGKGLHSKQICLLSNSFTNQLGVNPTQCLTLPGV